MLAAHEKLVDLALNVGPGLAPLDAIDFVRLEPIQFLTDQLQTVPNMFVHERFPGWRWNAAVLGFNRRLPCVHGLFRIG